MTWKPWPVGGSLLTCKPRTVERSLIPVPVDVLAVASSGKPVGLVAEGVNEASSSQPVTLLKHHAVPAIHRKIEYVKLTHAVFKCERPQQADIHNNKTTVITLQPDSIFKPNKW